MAAFDATEVRVMKVDPYVSLAKRFKLPYTYSWETDFFGELFLVREEPRNVFFSGPDPDFVSLDAKMFRQVEYDVGEELHLGAIATPDGVADFLRSSKVLRGIEIDWVHVPKRKIEACEHRLCKKRQIGDGVSGVIRDISKLQVKDI